MSLELQRLTVGYRRQPVFRALTLPAIEPGSLVAVVGPNAVGKSTLLKGIAGLLHASGQVRLNGQALHELAPAQRVTQLGYLPQPLPQAVPLVAYETVFSACRAARNGESRAATERAIEAVFDTLGIRQLALRQLAEMSGGQRQMVGLAQVLVRRPPLMLLDEPTSALDLHWQLNVLEAVRTATRERAAIALVASHDLNLALRFCDRVLVLSPGGRAEMGAPEAVLTPALLARTYGIEARIERCSRGHPIVLADRPLAR
ncbi:ABC transporter ATP-binding protein [Billgrantia gudaonensis]|uniref:Iron complex transport system ATP-binding protein n=1 Tax=Billgrantia gudaonensis TaxID=376427 RepID=A0A1G9EPL3_9GAMM|nr:ABC transporter ATP-binding protein [Halomonas gudaonensis]SDK77945.1 iron complex transport system ATP-binding protein [Halomonas gudaonensis]